ncbi:CCA tRNA nucleotidyltransferase [Natronoglomus mannanivorans]|uniref:CCA-adding enzyme n=1 Tax=Natronoglomus mannanivorans TaxID=2979990 RepID=A0AAP3E1L4_9EURY|nr:CCA tRNA nucleotidyltransferase [Halobacteria archaeon AArc-xg1-1]
MADEDEGAGGSENTAQDEATAEDFERVVSRVHDRIDPDAEERATLEQVAAALANRAADAATDRCPEADVLRVGSTARDTWISGDRDIDVFVRFPTDLDRETLEEYGLEVGHATLPEGHEEYAEHPYVKGEFDGFDVDVVPCFRVDDATKIRSAVDRTPFHTQYLEARLDDELASEVRLTKGFLKGIGVYGSNLRTRGFSGYLTELLVCEYGGFRPFLEAAADWQPPVHLDPEDHGRATFDDPLVVIDPTDPERNVAAVLSSDNVARLQHYARDVLADPRAELFDPDAWEPDPLSTAGLRDHLERRETTPIALRFPAPDLVDDQLYPQLRKSLAGIRSGLEDRDFDVLRAATFAGDDAVVFVELAVAQRPAVERHDGPPIHVRAHAEGFFEAYVDDPDAYGPFVDGDRYVVEREREFTTAREFLESDRLFDVGLGAHVETALEDGYELLVGEELTALLASEALAVELARYFDPRP